MASQILLAMKKYINVIIQSSYPRFVSRVFLIFITYYYYFFLILCSEPRGFAFVEFVDPYEASEAQYHMNGKNLLVGDYCGPCCRVKEEARTNAAKE